MPRKQAPASACQHADDEVHSPTAKVWTIKHGDADLHGIGDRTILRHPCLGLICSIQCPGSVVIRTFDAIRELRDASIVVASGFHSPIEKECLEFLLRGDQPVVVCQAKRPGRTRLPASWRPALKAGRLLMISPFGDNVRRTTSEQAQARNEFVTTLASVVLIPHASPGGKAEGLAQSRLMRGQPVFTFADEENKSLLQLGARAFNLDAINNLSHKGRDA